MTIVKTGLAKNGPAGPFATATGVPELHPQAQRLQEQSWRCLLTFIWVRSVGACAVQIRIINYVRRANALAPTPLGYELRTVVVQGYYTVTRTGVIRWLHQHETMTSEKAGVTKFQG